MRTVESYMVVSWILDHCAFGNNPASLIETWKIYWLTYLGFNLSNNFPYDFEYISLLLFIIVVKVVTQIALLIGRKTSKCSRFFNSSPIIKNEIMYKYNPTVCNWLDSYKGLSSNIVADKEFSVLLQATQQTSTITIFISGSIRCKGGNIIKKKRYNRTWWG